MELEREFHRPCGQITWREVLRLGERYLEQCGVADASVDAWLLLEHVTGLGRAQYLARACEPFAGGSADAEDQLQSYAELLKKRGSHIPLQYLTGEQEFMGLTFRVNEHVLIPRQDTETLVEEALARVRPGMRILDLCTGSGCIAISLAKLGPGDAPGLRVDASDISPEALSVAQENARRLGAQVRLMESDLFAGITDVYDMIVSNPPYIRTAVIGELSGEVRLHEPLLALDGREDGLSFYRRIAGKSRARLAEDGWLLLEIGHDQAEDVTGLLAEAGFEEIRTVRDLAGRDRVITARRGPRAEEI